TATTVGARTWPPNGPTPGRTSSWTRPPTTRNGSSTPAALSPVWGVRSPTVWTCAATCTGRCWTTTSGGAGRPPSAWSRWIGRPSNGRSNPVLVGTEPWTDRDFPRLEGARPRAVCARGRPEPSPALPTYRDRTSLPMKETGVSKAARREARRRAASTAGPARRIATVLVIALPVSQFHVEVYRVNTTNRRRLSNTGAPATNDTWVSTPAVNGQNH